MMKEPRKRCSAASLIAIRPNTAPDAVYACTIQPRIFSRRSLKIGRLRITCVANKVDLTANSFWRRRFSASKTGLECGPLLQQDPSHKTAPAGAGPPRCRPAPAGLPHRRLRTHLANPGGGGEQLQRQTIAGLRLQKLAV